MPSELQHTLAENVSYIKGRLDTVLPTIATKEFVRATVKEQLANHKTQCWRDATYQPADRLKDRQVGATPSIMPQSKKAIGMLAGAIVTLVGLFTLIFKWLLERLA